MLSRRLAAALRLPARSRLRRPYLRRADLSELARRLAHFWIVWSVLLLVHEAGHALSAARQGLAVRRVTAGIGPVIWRGKHADTEVVLRLVPLAGITTLGSERVPAASESLSGRSVWGAQLIVLAGGVLATLTLAVIVAGLVAIRERTSGARWRWGRYVVADAVVLTLFNFLPVPPLDGGRVVMGAVAAWRGAQLSADALFWVQLGGLALAVVPMTLWTRWTARIDSAAMRWGSPTPVARR